MSGSGKCFRHPGGEGPMCGVSMRTKIPQGSRNLSRLFVKAEGTLAFNNPAMMLVVYGCILAVSWFGARFYRHYGTMSSGGAGPPCSAIHVNHDVSYDAVHDICHDCHELLPKHKGGIEGGI